MPFNMIKLVLGWEHFDVFQGFLNNFLCQFVCYDDLLLVTYVVLTRRTKSIMDPVSIHEVFVKHSIHSPFILEPNYLRKISKSLYSHLTT